MHARCSGYLLALVGLFGGLAGCPSDDADPETTTLGEDGPEPTTTAAVTSGGSGTVDGSSGGTTSGSGSSGGVLPMVDYATDIQPIWNAACTCHLQGGSGTMQAPTLTLNEGTSLGELVGAASTQSDLARVSASDLEGSYLWHKLQDTHLGIGGSGTVMPQSGTLTDEQQLAIEAWIVSGAEP